MMAEAVGRFSFSNKGDGCYSISSSGFEGIGRCGAVATNTMALGHKVQYLRLHQLSLLLDHGRKASENSAQLSNVRLNIGHGIGSGCVWTGVFVEGSVCLVHASAPQGRRLAKIKRSTYLSLIHI